MPETLLQTKLFIPQPRPNLVPRPQLTERLNAGISGKLTLVSAPAGYGKTTLVAEWLVGWQANDSALGLTWLSLEESDNDLHRFLGYLIAAFQRIDPAIGVDLPSILESESSLPIESMLTSLLNDISVCGIDSSPKQRFALVLDDYHLITELNIHEALDFLIDHIPPCMHLVIMTRVDPPMPLGRLRVQRQLTEIRETDLRFTLEETATFLNDLMGLALSSEDVEKLESRTEGWIAGLLLFAMNLQGRTDKHERVLAFSGSHRHLLDYLIPEVLIRQPPEVQTFLLRTSILEQFNASLCETLIPGSDGREMLLTLEKANLFLIALDDKHEWYRYHHLFDDLLQQRLRNTTPEIIPALYVRASQWYEAKGLVDEAIERALDGRDAARAARLLDENVETFILVNGEITDVLLWADKIPEDVRARFPRLCVYHALALILERQPEAVEPALILAEAHLNEPENLPENFQASQITGFANMVRAHAALQRGDYEQAVELALAALRDLPEGDADSDGSSERGHPTREASVLPGALKTHLGMGYYALGQMDMAQRSLQNALLLSQQAGIRFVTLSCIEYLMLVEIARGGLRSARANFEKGLLWNEGWSGSEGVKRRPVRVLANLRLSMSEVLYELNELELAADYLKKATEYYELTQSWSRLQSYVLHFDLEQARGNLDTALGYLQKLKQLSLMPGVDFDDIPLTTQIAERNLMLSQVQPDLIHLFSEAVDWAESSGMEPSDPIRYEQENEYLTLARILIAQGKTEEAIRLLDRLIQSAENDGRWGDLIPRLALQAIAHHAQDRTNKALTFLSQALKMAEPEGYIRTFVDLGPQMRELLQVAAERGIGLSFVPTLIAAFAQDVDVHPAPLVTHPLVEPLTDREIQILRLLAARLSYREIADELYLSVNTIKWYARTIYGKLGVNSKVEAADRARELSIV
ncbi:MAG: LuxR C-terminal-related transcriptional regulator [Candidatus Promineifilaceae bacterium]